MCFPKKRKKEKDNGTKTKSRQCKIHITLQACRCSILVDRLLPFWYFSKSVFRSTFSILSVLIFVAFSIECSYCAL